MTDTPPKISPAQSRAARGLLGWSQQDLATAAGLKSWRTIQRFESGERVPRAVADIVTALETAGVEFTNGNAPGVRLLPRA